MMIHPQTFCSKCGKKVDYRIDLIQVTLEHNGITFSYQEAKAHCVNCRKPVYVAALADHNCNERLKAYYQIEERIQNGNV